MTSLMIDLLLNGQKDRDCLRLSLSFLFFYIRKLAEIYKKEVIRANLSLSVLSSIANKFKHSSRKLIYCLLVLLVVVGVVGVVGVGAVGVVAVIVVGVVVVGGGVCCLL